MVMMLWEEAGVERMKIGIYRYRLSEAFDIVNLLRFTGCMFNTNVQQCEVQRMDCWLNNTLYSE